MDKKISTLIFRCAPALRDAIAARAKQERRSLGNQIRVLLEKELGEQSKAA